MILKRVFPVCSLCVAVGGYGCGPDAESTSDVLDSYKNLAGEIDQALKKVSVPTSDDLDEMLLQTFVASNPVGTHPTTLLDAESVILSRCPTSTAENNTIVRYLQSLIGTLSQPDFDAFEVLRKRVHGSFSVSGSKNPSWFHLIYEKGPAKLNEMQVSASGVADGVFEGCAYRLTTQINALLAMSEAEPPNENAPITRRRVLLLKRKRVDGTYRFRYVALRAVQGGIEPYILTDKSKGSVPDWPLGAPASIDTLKGNAFGAQNDTIFYTGAAARYVMGRLVKKIQDTKASTDATTWKDKVDFYYTISDGTTRRQAYELLTLVELKFRENKLDELFDLRISETSSGAQLSGQNCIARRLVFQVVPYALSKSATNLTQSLWARMMQVIADEAWETVVIGHTKADDAYYQQRLHDLRDAAEKALPGHDLRSKIQFKRRAKDVVFYWTGLTPADRSAIADLYKKKTG